MKGALITMTTAFLLLTGISCTTAKSGEERNAIVMEDFGSPDEGGWLGVAVEDLTRDLAKDLKTDTKEGAVITRVVKNSPAEKAGLKENDIIVGVNKHEIGDRWDLVRRIRSEDPGTSVSLSVIRDNKKHDLHAVLGESPEPLPAIAPIPPVPPVPHLFMTSESQSDGLQLMALNEQLGEYFGTPNKRGVLVEEVLKESNGAKAGFKAGDVIVRVGNYTIEDLEDFHNALRHFDEGDTAQVEIVRKGTQQTLALQIHGDDHEYHFRSHGVGPRWDHQSYEWDSREFKNEMKNFGEKMREFGNDLKQQMKGMKERLREELRHIEV